MVFVRAQSTPSMRGSIVSEVNAAVLASSRGTSWQTQLNHTFTVTFASADARFKFFRDLGEIRLSGSRSGGSSTDQNSDWTALWITFNVFTFNKSEYDDITTSYTTIYTDSGASPYTDNDLVIKAKKDATGVVLTFDIQLIDAYAGTPDSVDGTMATNVDEYIDDAATSPVYATTVALTAGS